MLQASFVIGTVITFYISKIASLEFMQFVELNTAVLIASYSLFYVVLYHFSKAKIFNHDKYEINIKISGD